MRRQKNNSNKIKNQEIEFFPDEIVDIVKPREEESYEGKIIAIKGDIIVVHNLHNGKEESYDKNEKKILKQWGPSRPLQKYNRIDFELSETNFWVEAVVLEIDHSTREILVKYRNSNRYKRICKERIKFDSKRIAPIGLFTKYDINNLINSSISAPLDKSNIINLLGKKTKNSNNNSNNNIALNKEQELKFQYLMKKNNFEIIEIDGDGNCLFRAVSDQVYGSDEYHEIIRQKCMDYLEVQKKFFKLFIEGDFDDYIKKKRKNGIWGDDIELESLSEIYNRPIEIYSGSATPIKCFHENKNSSNFISKDGNIITPIRLSYHGRKHYNSVRPLKDANYKYKCYEMNLIKTKPGIYEDKIIDIAKDNEDRLDKGIKKSEEEYLDKLKNNLSGKKNEEFLNQIILDLNKKSENKNDDDNDDKELPKENEYKKKKTESYKDEKKDNDKNKEEEKSSNCTKEDFEINKKQEEKEKNDKKEDNKNEKEKNDKKKNEKEKEKNGQKSEINEDEPLLSNSIIKSALELGFDYNEVVEAWIDCGENDKEILINYLLNTRSNNN